MLVAGAARVDITPSDPGRTFLAGFGVGRRARGVLDPLEAGALFLEDGRRSLALVAVDCVGLTRSFVEMVRERLSGQVDLQAVIVCATHTHSGPDTMGLWGPGLFGAIPVSSGVDRAYQELLAQRLVAAVVAAREGARPARLRAATFDTPSEWSRNERQGGERFDQATAFALEDEQGRRIATALNWASHPEALWEDNLWLSPDYPGHFRDAVRREVGGEAFFFPGPLGAMLTPDIAREKPLADRVELIEKLGADLARLALAELAGSDLHRSARLEHQGRTVSLVNDNRRFALMERLGLVTFDSKRGRLACELHHVRLGPLEILTVPGEPAPEVGRQLLAVLPQGQRALFALAVDEIGYILDDRQHGDPRYRYERSMSLGRGTAAALREAASELMRQGSP
jgi:hypothetical protein